MKLAGIISTAVLSFTLGVAAPAYAQQEQHDQQEEQKAKPAQDEKKAQPEKPAKPGTRTSSRKRKTRNSRTGTRIRKKKARNSRTRTTSKKRRTRSSKRETTSRKIETHSNARNRLSQHSKRSAAMPAAFQTTVTGPILDRSIGFVSANPITVIAASNTAAIRSDSLTRGRATGSTPRTFLWSR